MRFAFVLCIGVPAIVMGQGAGLRGRVVNRVTGEALAYGAVSIVGQPIERLTNSDGRFFLALPKGGRVTLRVRHVGYTPAELPLDLRARDTLDVRVEMTPVPVLLPVVHSTDDRCRSPGPPRGADTLMRMAFQQLEANAAQFRLVSTAYPFVSVLTRRLSRIVELRRPTDGRAGMDTSETVTSVDTVNVRSDQPWHYEPGRVIGIDLSRQSGSALMFAVNIPTLAVFTDKDFQNAHCFTTNGATDGVVEIDFQPAEHIRDPDLAGSLYLDAKTFAIRRSVIRLSRPSPYASSYDTVSVETRFVEILPGLPVIAAISGRNVLTADASRQQAGAPLPDGLRFLADLELQRVQEIRFIAGRPGGDTTAFKPPVATSSPATAARIQSHARGRRRQ